MKPEERVSRDIRKFLLQLGFAVWSTEQGYRKERGGTRTTAGIPDLIVAGHNRTLFVEVKTPKGKLTMWQLIFRKVWEESGGTSLVWRSVNDARDWLVNEGIIKEAQIA